MILAEGATLLLRTLRVVEACAVLLLKSVDEGMTMVEGQLKELVHVDPHLTLRKNDDQIRSRGPPLSIYGYCRMNARSTGRA